ncbi:MAG: sulfatase-like hydrolase/transferase [Flavobacteriaceae bacterium]|jgi:phosphoglycerol transferase MdoB-like AlkP superfamily enzyme
MDFRLKEFIALFYRIFLVYLCYFFCRILFVFFNNDLVQVASISELAELCYYSLRFDNVAIVYSNMIFILMSIIPWKKTTYPLYQKVVFWVYIACNAIFLSLNFVDFAYYRFNQNRLMSNFLEVVEFETNKATLFLHFTWVYLHLFLLYFALLYLLVVAYKRVKIYPVFIRNHWRYGLSSVIFFFGVITLFVLGARGGDFKKSTRPITLIDAMDNVKNPQHADVILSSTFTLLKTLGQKNPEISNLYSDEEAEQELKTLKQYPPSDRFEKQPNVVIFILESMGREYWGALNETYNIPEFKSYTPFLDSLAQSSLIFPNAFATSRKSIHGMPSVLAGIPSFEKSYASSLYSRQKVASVVSVAHHMGYNSSFFHGAANGSMGFMGFANTLGFEKYYGRSEFDNDEEFDGSWGIWDEPFLLYMKSVLDTQKTPFLSSVFTVTSHEPYVIPEAYEGKFDKGDIPMHQCVGYTDNALRKFFEESKSAPWFEDTIFIFTADHSNQVHYPFYLKTVNRFANPIMIFKPNSDLKGMDLSLASHMDIFPTVADLIDYPKPFKSWGRSLVSDQEFDPFVINYFSGGSYFIMDENFICVHNGKKAIGFYEVEDKNMENNLIENKTEEMLKLERRCSVFLEDYFESLMSAPKNIQNKD